MKEKIGMYTEQEIFDYMTKGEGSMLGRSMYDAIMEEVTIANDKLKKIEEYLKNHDEEIPNKIRIEPWCYKFEWVEHLDSYYDKSVDLDLMSSLSMSKEELNYKVKIIEEDKPIEKLDYEINENNVDVCTEKIRCKINELIDKVNKLHEESRKDGEV